MYSSNSTRNGYLIQTQLLHRYLRVPVGSLRRWVATLKVAVCSGTLALVLVARIDMIECFFGERRSLLMAVTMLLMTEARDFAVI